LENHANFSVFWRRVLFNGIDKSDTPPKDRKIGMVFQNYALYPHLTSKKNMLTYYLFRKKDEATDKEAEEKFKKTSELLGVDIQYLLDRSPSKLSGGEKQRVAIGRCITRDPSVFLMDEPLASLDTRLRERYRIQLKILLKKFNVTSVYVTHDHQEALILADTLVVMNKGKIQQTGTFQEIYTNPVNIFVAEFINPNTESTAINLIDGCDISNTLDDLIIGIRPEDITVTSENEQKAIPCTISSIRNIPVKNAAFLDLTVGKREVCVKVNLPHDYQPQQHIGLIFSKFFVFDRLSGERLENDISLF
jgi:ABC-type sugar transport system ATPase subunit